VTINISKGNEYPICFETMETAAKDLEHLLSGEGHSRLRAYAKLVLNEALLAEANAAEWLSTEEKKLLEYRLYPMGSSVLNSKGKRVRSNYNVDEVREVWEEHIDDLRKEVKKNERIR